MALRLRRLIIPSLLTLCALPPASHAAEPLLIIRFNRHHVYYERALMEATQSTRQVKPGASYRLVSSTPPGNSPSQTDRMAKDAQANIQAVVQQMEVDGVAEAQIHIETTTGNPGEPQVIQIFVK